MPKQLNVKIEDVPLDLLKTHPRNVNQGDFGAIQESIETNGFYGTIVANKKNGHILAGNHRYIVAKRLGFETVPVTWVDVSPEDEIRILIADNRTTRLGIDDQSGLAELLSELAQTDGGLTGTGFDGDDLDNLINDLAGVDSDDESNYSRKIEAPIYEPKGLKPTVDELFDLDKYLKLVGQIRKATIPDEVKQFLIFASSRHIVFDYRNIAEFYSHSDAETQQLFEDNALVIIDFEQAIQNGFVKLTGELQEVADIEYKSDK